MAFKSGSSDTMSNITFAENPVSEPGATLRGLLVLMVLLLGTGWASGGSFLLGRNLWMDEVHSWLIVTDPDATHAMQALADGVDFNPPTWFVITRVLSQALGFADEVVLREISLFWMLMTLAGLFIILSRVFDARISIASVLLVACHPLLIHQSTEIRFYGFWCATVTWLCVVLQWNPEPRRYRRLQMLLTVSLAAFVATCHYFGILSLGLVVTPLILRRKSDVAGFRQAVAVLIAGLIALGLCLPFLVSQRAALSRPTWISATTLEDSVLFLQTMLPAWPLIACVAGLILTLLVSRRTVPCQLLSPLPTEKSALLPCLSLALMPLAIVAVAWTVQPALVTRYAIVGIPGLAPVFAAILYQCSQRVQSSLIVVALAGLNYSVVTYQDQWNSEQKFQVDLLAELKTCPQGSTIVFEDRIQWMPIVQAHSAWSLNYRLVDFSDSLLKQDSALRIVQRDVGRRIGKWYPQFRMQSAETLSEQPEFFVVRYESERDPGVRYPARFRSEPFTSLITRFTRQAKMNASTSGVEEVQSTPIVKF